ncbi:hypothetical protein C0991_002594 [Blastosporella zonata]|nr:hypothetical protein C0991_002594 [Blastosporella zonata]
MVNEIRNFQEHRPDLAEHIRTCSERPSVAFSEARRFQPEVRRDWKDVNIAKMDIVLQLKFEQHDDLRAELLGTGHANLFEDSDKDAFWGVGPDWTGRNELGKALERLRTKLRAASRKSIIQPASATSHNLYLRFTLHSPAVRLCPPILRLTPDLPYMQRPQQNLCLQPRLPMTVPGLRGIFFYLPVLHSPLSSVICAAIQTA